MVTHFFMSGLLLISLSCIITVCYSNESKSGILLDITEQIKDSRYSRAKIDAVVKSLIDHNTDNGNKETVTLYYEHFYKNETYDFRTAVNRIGQLESRFRLLINVKERDNIDHVNDIAKFVKFRYSQILNIIAQSTLISSVSFEFIDGTNICSNNSPTTNTTLIEEIQQLLRIFTKRDLQMGYKLNFTQLKCRKHSRYIKNSNYLIINIPFKRNDKIFVESFDVFKNNMKKMNTRTKSFVQDLYGDNYTRPIYYKLTLHTNLNLENDQSTKCVKGHVTKKGLEIIKMAAESIENVHAEYMDRYENLLAHYCRQLGGLDGQDETFILKISLENSTVQQALVIPQLPTLPVSDLGASGMRSISFLLEEIVVSDFNTIMINGEIWQEMIKKGVSKSNCHIAQCRPQNVMYLNDKHYAFSNYNERNITALLEVDGMHLRTLVFSRYYKEKSHFNWKNAVDSLQRATDPAVGLKTGCTELTNIFGEILNNGTFGIFCHSLELYKTLGCGSLLLSSNIIVWRGELVFHVYSLDSFVESTMKKLDALVLGRQIMKNMRKNSGQNENVEVILRIKVKYEREGKTVIGNHMYCTNLGAIVYRLYEMLLTWAHIHDFTVILEPISDTFGYDNPISWKQLEITATGRIRNLMVAFPIFIRRSYNTSRVFGSWTSGMYSCIQHSKTLESEISFLKLSTGATIYFNVRTGNISISTEELKIMLLFAFGKFSTVEVVIRSQSDLQVLYDTVQQPDFDSNLKDNNISRKNVSIDVSISLSENQTEMVTKIVKILEKVGLQVQIHHPNTNLFSFETGIFIENCAETANDILSSHFDTADKIRAAKYIVCDTSPKSAQNEDKNSMRDYLDSHLYLQKLFQYLFRNLTGVYFRLHPRLVGNTFHERSQNLLLFLADIHKYSIAYGVNYFILPVLSQDENMASFWTTTNLLDIDAFIERQANLLGQTNWKPIIANYNRSSTSSPAEESTKSSTINPINGSKTAARIPNSFTESTAEVGDTTIVSTQPNINSRSEQAISFENLLSSYFLYIIIGASLIIMLLLLTVSIKVFKNRRYLTTKEVTDFIQGRRETLEEAVVRRKRQTRRNFNVFDGLVYQKDYEISNENIKLDKKPASIISKGKFSKVYLAKLSEATNDVLVEICNKRISKTYFTAMLSEVKMLCYIGKHDNIVDFIGSYTGEITQGVLWIVREYCQKGSLYEYLQVVKDDIRSQTLIRFAKEISSGMDYLSCQDVIHGDLRTKNVFLDQLNKTCKIGNFGVSRKSLEYKMLTKKGKYNLLPLRWMAFETLHSLEFSSNSDIWSYGVTIWEILSTGNLPYGEDVVEKATLIKMLKEETRLECPNRASPATYLMMTQCWALNPKHRPDFATLATFFSDLLSTFKDESMLCRNFCRKEVSMN